MTRIEKFQISDFGLWIEPVLLPVAKAMKTPFSTALVLREKLTLQPAVRTSAFLESLAMPARKVPLPVFHLVSLVSLW